MGESEPQMMKPPEVTFPSECHVNVSPGPICTLRGPTELLNLLGGAGCSQMNGFETLHVSSPHKPCEL